MWTAEESRWICVIINRYGIDWISNGRETKGPDVDGNLITEQRQDVNMTDRQTTHGNLSERTMFVLYQICEQLRFVTDLEPAGSGSGAWNQYFLDRYGFPFVKSNLTLSFSCCSVFLIDITFRSTAWTLCPCSIVHISILCSFTAIVLQFIAGD